MGRCNLGYHCFHTCSFFFPSPPPTPTPSSSSTLIGPLQMLISQSILNRFGSNFGFYISGPIITKYIIPHQISTNPPPSNIKISTNLNYFKCFYLSQFSIDFGLILDSKTYDQAKQTYDTTA